MAFLKVNTSVIISTRYIISVTRELAPFSIDNGDWYTTITMTNGSKHYTRLPIADTIGRLRIGADLYPI